MEERSQNSGPIRELGSTTETEQPLQNLVPDQRRGFLRKLADAFFKFIGYHRVGEPWRNRLRD